MLELPCVHDRGLMLSSSAFQITHSQIHNQFMHAWCCEMLLLTLISTLLPCHFHRYAQKNHNDHGSYAPSSGQEKPLCFVPAILHDR